MDAIIAVGYRVNSKKATMFRIWANGEPNEVTYAAIASAEGGADMYGPFDCAADLMAALDAPDVAAAESSLL